MIRAAIFLLCFAFGSFVVSTLSSDRGDVEQIRIAGADLVVEVYKTHTHPFLAEYDFKLVLRVGSEAVDAVEMTGDSGGLSRIEVMRLASGMIAFRDHGTTECLNVAKEKFEYCDSTLPGTRIGYIDFDATKTWRFIRRDGERN